MKRLCSPQRVLAIVGAAFLIATAHALIAPPVVLGPTATRAGTEGVTGDPRRATPDSEGESQSQSDPSTQTPAPATADPEVPEGKLSLAESRELWDKGAYFIDARYKDEFAQGRIEYAQWLPATRFDTDFEGAMRVVDSIPPDGTIVIYCVGGDCDASENTAARLEQYGFTDLRIMGVGYTDWIDAGYPTGAGPIDNAGGSP